MSTKKMGRPPLPDGQIKTDLIGVRLKPDKAKKIADVAKDAAETPAEVMRQATDEYMKNAPVWVTTQWPVSALHCKKITFLLTIQGTQQEVTGELHARERPDGKKSVNICIFIYTGTNQGMQTTIRLSQREVDKIKPADPSEGADFILSA
jgi:surface antigen